MAVDIAANLAAYQADLGPGARYASFDYCFNYFQGFRETETISELADDGHLQTSCLQLGFYLASWGMLRGSSVLLRRSVKHYVPVVEAITAVSPSVWAIDVDSYSTPRATGVIMETARQIRAAFPEPASDILVTKIMLGVFGCVPAFDTYFKKGFGVWTFGAGALDRVRRFYEDNRAVIESSRDCTLDFATGLPTHRRYPIAKVIDMIFFIEGGLAPAPAGGATRPGDPGF